MVFSYTTSKVKSVRLKEVYDFLFYRCMREIEDRWTDLDIHQNIALIVRWVLVSAGVNIQNGRVIYPNNCV